MRWVRKIFNDPPPPPAQLPLPPPSPIEKKIHLLLSGCWEFLVHLSTLLHSSLRDFLPAGPQCCGFNPRIPVHQQQLSARCHNSCYSWPSSHIGRALTLLSAVIFNSPSAQGDIRALLKDHTRSTPSFRSLPKVTLENSIVGLTEQRGHYSFLF